MTCPCGVPACSGLGNPPTVAELIRPERLTPEQMDWMPSIDVSGTDLIYVGPVPPQIPPQRDGSADYTRPPYQPRHRGQLRPERTTG